MMFRIAVICFLLMNGFSASAQIETVLWQNCLGTQNGKNWTKTVEKSENGYFFGIGLQKDGPGVTNYHGSADAWIVKTDYSGNIIWEKCFGGSEGEGAHKIIRIDENTCYLLNSSWSSDGDVQNGRDGNFWIVKIDSGGSILWENSYGGCILGDEVRDAILMPDNGLVCMGRISSTGGDITTHYGNMDIWLFRIDSSGNLLWEKTFGNQGVDEAIKIKLTSKSTVLMIGCHDESAGMIDCPEPYGYYADVWVVEMDLHGNMLNHWCYGGKYWDQGFDIVEVQDGYVIASYTTSNDGDVSGLHGTPGDFSDIWAFKIDLYGNLIWQKCLGGYSSELPEFISETEDGGLVIIGNTNSHDGDVTGNHTTEWNESDIWVVKLSVDGQLLWEHCFGGLGTDRFWGEHSVLKKDDYNYIIGANSDHASGDVTCDLFLNDGTANAWIFEIKDCNYYLPASPEIYSGPDTLCSADSINAFYRINPSTWAWDYEWSIFPEEAGTVLPDSLSVVVTWNPAFEGPVEIKARSYNDCGYSEWSAPFITQVYTCLGIEEQGGGEAWGQGSLVVWPNPVKEIVHCRLFNVDCRSDCSLMIYDIFGRMVHKMKFPVIQNEVQIDVEGYPPGIYLAILWDGNSMLSDTKFVIVK